MEASEKGHFETVEVLIKGGANIDLTDEVGPLFPPVITLHNYHVYFPCVFIVIVVIK